MDVQVLTVASKGQISLPSDICRLLSIEAGDKLAAYTSGNTIVLKTLKLPSADDFENSLYNAGKWTEPVGSKEDDVNDIIKYIREMKKNCPPMPL